MNNSKQAERLFDDGYSCSQTVLAVFAEQFKLSKDMANKIASAFGGGLASTGETCGAVTGALMVLGLKFGRTQPEDLASKKKTNDLSNIFFDKFKAKHNSLLCRDLKLQDRSTPEKKKLAHKICSNYIKDAVSILEEILEKDNSK